MYNNQDRLLRPDVRCASVLDTNEMNCQSARDAGAPKVPIPESPQLPTQPLPPHCHAPPPCPSLLTEDDVFQASFQICCMVNLTATFSTFCDRFKQGHSSSMPWLS
jgi:hypothetical protein